METQIAEENITKTVNFLKNEKTLDWRYRAYKEILNSHHKKLDEQSSFISKKGQSVIYWIGIVSLEHVNKEELHYPIFFADHRFKLVEDAHRLCDEDGASSSSYLKIKFCLSTKLNRFILDDMIKAKIDGYKYYHFFLEEKVNGFGEHEVSILILRKNIDGPFGVPSRKPWPEEKTSYWIEYANFKLPEENDLERFTILYNKEYSRMR